MPARSTAGRAPPALQSDACAGPGARCVWPAIAPMGTTMVLAARALSRRIGARRDKQPAAAAVASLGAGRSGRRLRAVADALALMPPLPAPVRRRHPGRNDNLLPQLTHLGAEIEARAAVGAVDRAKDYRAGRPVKSAFSPGTVRCSG